MSFRETNNLRKELGSIDVSDTDIDFIKFTESSNMIIHTKNQDVANRITTSTELFKSCKKINLNLENKKFFFVIKGLTFKEADENRLYLNSIGITDVHNISKKPVRIVKASCEDIKTLDELRKSGLRLNFCKYNIGDYKKPDHIIQCFSCQSFGHLANNCTNIARCIRCKGAHKLMDCKQPRQKKIKCVNCDGAHPSSFAGCPKYQEAISKKKSENTFNPFIKTFSTAKSYSEIASQRTKESSEILKAINEVKSEINEIKVSLKNFEDSTTFLNRRIDHLSERLDDLDNETYRFKESLVYFVIDALKIAIPDKTIGEAGCRALAASINNHGIFDFGDDTHQLVKYSKNLKPSSITSPTKSQTESRKKRKTTEHDD